jgi:hypothetical protein
MRLQTHIISTYTVLLRVAPILHAALELLLHVVGNPWHDWLLLDEFVPEKYHIHFWL